MRTIDLFSGCGGMSLGFEKADFTIIRAYENWDTAIETYQKNFSHPVIHQDLSDTETVISSLSNTSIDCIVGGPPCQDFSQAGTRIEGTHADLTLAFAKIVSSIRPEWFVMENVDRAQKSKAYSRSRNYLKNAGYGLTEVILDASKCGVPQKRKRFFSIGRLGEENNFLLDKINRNLSKKPTTIRDYLGTELGIENYYRHPRNYNRRAIFSIDEPAPTIRGVNRPVPKGYIGHPNDTALITDNIRALTTMERARLQTFPNDFRWPDTSKSKLEQMIGNAVPGKMAEYIGNAIKTYQFESDNKYKEDFSLVL